MNKITKIVELILKEIVKTNDFELFEKKIFNKLSYQGYNKSDIYTAFNYFNTKIISKNLLSLSKNQENFTVRILSDFEKRYFTPEAEKYLLSYIYTNKLKWDDVENILYRIIRFNDIVDKEKIKHIIYEKILSDSSSEESYIH